MALKIDTRPNASSSSQEEHLTRLDTPTFRSELKKSAPRLVEDFDTITRERDDRLEDFGRRYNRAKTDLAKERAAAASDKGNMSHGSHPGTNNDSSLSGPQQSAQSRAEKLAARAERKARFIASTQSNGSTRSNASTTTTNSILTIQVQIRLVPAIKLLTGPSPSPADRSRAKDIAHAAQKFARENDASNALMARCSFYIAHAHLKPHGSISSQQDAMNWFQRAVEASEGGYPEGQWAQEWLNHSLSLNPDSRPSSSGSWFAKTVNGVWNMFSGSRNNSTTSAVASQPQSNASWSPRSNSSSARMLPRGRQGERIPSFSTMKSSTVASSDSRSSASTQDHYGLKWSPKSPWGKGEIVKGQRFELVNSPEPIDEVEDENDEEQDMPANVFGGLVEAAALSPAMQRSPRKRSSINYIPEGVLDKNSNIPSSPHRLRIANPTSPPRSPLSPLSSQDHPAQSSNPSTHSSSKSGASSYFTAQSTPHSRAPSHSSVTFANPSSPPDSSPTGSGPEAVGGPASSSSSSSRSKKRNSLSLMILGRTGLGVHGKRDEAAQMEEGESPFRPRAEEEALYRMEEWE